jgi:hypothetical protein
MAMKKMRGLKLALPVAAIAIGAMMFASSALAAGPLVLKDEGKTVARGSKTENRFTSAKGCEIAFFGEVVINKWSPDVLSGTSSAYASCEEKEEKISGLITETWLTSQGTAILQGSITLSTSASCSYVFKNLKGTFGVPGFAFVKLAPATGKLTESSSKSCAPEVTEQFWSLDFGEIWMFETSIG